MTASLTSFGASVFWEHFYMVQFLLFRHGETDWNLKKIFQGHTDIPLNQTGISQAQSLAEKVRHWQPDVILSSDLSRAFHTAEFCQMEWRVKVLKTAELREMHLGQAEGLHRDDVMKLIGPDMWVQWLGHREEDEHFKFPEGESKHEARMRILNYLEKFSKKHPELKRIAVSTHGGVLKRVTHNLQGVPFEGVPIPNCVTYRLNFDGYTWRYVQVRERASSLIIHDGKILTFVGIDPHSGQQYHFLPGGLIESGESVEDCIVRETSEETGYIVEPTKKKVISEYDFNWNNQDYWCRTHFVRAQLQDSSRAPQLVQDAEYNKGTKWIPAQDYGYYFDYNKSILESVRALMQEL